LHKLQNSRTDLFNQETVRKDVESVCSILFSDEYFCNRLQESGVPPDTARLSVTDHVEVMITFLCKERAITYLPGLAMAFMPLFLLGGVDPLRVDIFRIMESMILRVIPHVAKNIPLQIIADARRPLIKLLLLYHDPVIAIHLDHNFPVWVNMPEQDKECAHIISKDSFGALYDTWIASLFESEIWSSTTTPSLIWDCMLLISKYPSITMCFILIYSILKSKKRLLSLESATSLRSCMVQLLVESLTKPNVALIQGTQELIETTPFSFCTKLCDVGINEEKRGN